MDEVWQQQNENNSGMNEEQEWVFHTMHEVDDIIKRYGVGFFIEHLPRFSKIAIIAYGKQGDKNANTERIKEEFGL